MTGEQPRRINVSVVPAEVPPRTDPSNESSRVLLVIGKALANLVAVTLRHGKYETRDCTTETEARQLMRDWRPHMALIDIDHHQNFIEILGGGMSNGGMALLAFTRKRDT